MPCGLKTIQLNPGALSVRASAEAMRPRIILFPSKTLPAKAATVAKIAKIAKLANLARFPKTENKAYHNIYPPPI